MTGIRHLIPIALISTLAAVPADASYSRDTAPKATVSYGDLNLNSEAGVAALDHRIARAVRQVCGDRSEGTLRERRDAEKCGDETMLIVNPQRDRAIAFAGSKPIQLGANQR